MVTMRGSSFENGTPFLRQHDNTTASGNAVGDGGTSSSLLLKHAGNERSFASIPILSSPEGKKIKLKVRNDNSFSLNSSNTSSSNDNIDNSFSMNSSSNINNSFSNNSGSNISIVVDTTTTTTTAHPSPVRRTRRINSTSSDRFIPTTPGKSPSHNNKILLRRNTADDFNCSNGGDGGSGSGILLTCREKSLSPKLNNIQQASPLSGGSSGGSVRHFLSRKNSFGGSNNNDKNSGITILLSPPMLSPQTVVAGAVTAAVTPLRQLLRRKSSQLLNNNASDHTKSTTNSLSGSSHHRRGYYNNNNRNHHRCMSNNRDYTTLNVTFAKKKKKSTTKKRLQEPRTAATAAVLSDDDDDDDDDGKSIETNDSTKILPTIGTESFDHDDNDDDHDENDDDDDTDNSLLVEYFSPPENEITESERRDYYYTKEDLANFEKDSQLTLLQFRSMREKNIPWEENEHSLRGLEEYVFTAKVKNRRQARKEHIEAVLQSQRKLKAQKAASLAVVKAVTTSAANDNVTSKADEVTTTGPVHPSREQQQTNNMINVEECIRDVSIALSRQDMNRAIALASRDAKEAGYTTNGRQFLLKKLRDLSQRSLWRATTTTTPVGSASTNNANNNNINNNHTNHESPRKEDTTCTTGSSCAATTIPTTSTFLPPDLDSGVDCTNNGNLQEQKSNNTCAAMLKKNDCSDHNDPSLHVPNTSVEE